MKIIDVYFLRSTLAPFLLTFGIIYLIMVTRQIYQIVLLIETVELNLLDLGWMMLLNAPTNISLLAPTAICIAVFGATNTASMHHELVALHSLSISLTRLLKMVLKFSFLVGLMLALFTLYINPIANYQLVKFQKSLTEQKYKLKLNPQSINFIGENMIYFRAKSGDQMENLVISVEEPQKMLIYAKSGELMPEQSASSEMLFKLNSGAFLMDEGRWQQIHRFETADISINRPEIENDGADILADEAKWSDIRYLFNKPYLFLTIQDMWRLVASPLIENDKKRRIVMEFNTRLMVVFATIAFAVFSFSLGIVNPRMPAKGNMLWLIVGLVLYYQFTAIIRRVVDHQLINPLIMFLPPIVMFGVGLMFFQFANQNRPFGLLNLKIWSLFDRIIFSFENKKE